MFDQFLNEYRSKAVEATTQFQQQLMRSWIQQWPGMLLGGKADPASWVTQAHDAQKKWAETVTDMLSKHRETLDAQYRAGIRTIEEAFRVGEAKDPEQFRKLAEGLWRQNIECLKTFVETQLRDGQVAMQKMFEVASKSAAAVK